VVYVVNEWGSGMSLDRLLVDGPLSARRAAWVVREVADAIATAHRNGVAHGRLLPENVMISESGAVKVIGFVVDSVLRSGAEQHLVTGGGPVDAQEADVLNLAGLLYAALVGRWPGTGGSTIPTAPSEHGRPLRPRQVRAGVPRPLDAICERVLNAGSHPQMVPIRTAHEIFAALSDFIGEPGAAVPVGVPHGSTSITAPVADPSTLLQRSATSPGDGAGTHAGDLDGPDRSDGEDEDTSDLPTTEPALGPVTAGDLEATQAGAPMFFDADSGIGWLSTEGSRGVRVDGSDPAQEPTGPGRSTPRTPPAPPPEPPLRRLFADEPTTPAHPADREAGGGPDTGRDPGLFAWAEGDEADEPSADDSAARGARLDRAGHGPASSFAGGQHDTGAGLGSVPPTWGPDVDPPTPGGGTRWAGRPARPPGRGWFRLAVLLGAAVLVVVAAVFAFDLGRGPAGDPTSQPTASGSPSRSTGPPTAVRIAGVQDFDPQGDPDEENPELARLAVDGKPGTAWETVTYRGNPRLGGLKQGVGLLVDLGRATRVRDVRVTLLGRPTSLDVLAAAPGARTAPTSRDGLVKVGSVDAAGATAEVTPDRAVSTRWLVVWLTSLPPADGGYQGRVAEISVRS